MAVNKVPHFLNDMRVYLNGADEFVGAKSIELPNFETMTATAAGIGISGEIDHPVRGHFQSMETTIEWNTTAKTGLSLIGGDPVVLEAYGSNQNFDEGKNDYVDEQVRVAMRGTCKSYTTGTWQAGNTSDASTVIEVHYIKVDVDGQTVVEIDKYGYKCVINGRDLMAAIRRNIGMG